MESLLFSKNFFEKIGIKAAEKAPSAVILLNRLGSLNAIKNASATKVMPITLLNIISRISPKILLNAVEKLTIIILREGFFFLSIVA